jgi:TATA-box binding protein (TBP) (component of TFIID and TFIIIB)
VELIVNQIVPSDTPNRLNLDTISVKMINTNFSLNSSVNLSRVIQAFSQPRGTFLVTFDPDRYSAVKVKFCPAPGMKRVTASIFSTGKIIVTGAQTLKEIALSYKIINEVLAPASVRLGVSDKKDVFDTILGHKFSEWVPKLQARGITHWVS